MTDARAIALIEAVLAGDATAVPALAEVGADLHVALGQSDFVLQHEAVIAVLRKLAAGEISPDVAGRWGVLMFWGVIEGACHNRKTGLTFWYEPAYDDSIATAVLRLEQIGDLIDGEVTAAECAQLIDSLSRPDQPDREG